MVTHVEEPIDHTIALIGEPGTGKTSIMNALMGLPFGNDNISDSTSLNAIPIFENRKSFKLKISNDTIQERTSQVRKELMVDTDAAILVFDLTDRYSFSKVTEWVKEYCEANKMKKTPILIVGNKLDLSSHRMITLRDVQSLLKLIRDNPQVEGRIIGYAETSAKTGENVKTSFKNLTSIISSAS